MHKFLDVSQEERLERRHKAVAYSTRVALREQRREKRLTQFSNRMLKGAIGFFLWAVILAMLVGCV